MKAYAMTIRPEDMDGASILINYTDGNGKVDDVISIPVDGLTTGDLIALSACSRTGGSMYDSLFSSHARLYAPISMSTMLTCNYDDIDWHKEDGKLDAMMDGGTIARVSLNIAYDHGGVYTLDFPKPTDDEVRRLYGM